MPRARTIATSLAALACAGCGGGGDDRSAEPARPSTAVQGSLDLDRSAAGAPDAGTRGGHGADRYVVQAAGPMVTIAGKVRPPSATLHLADAARQRIARVNVASDGGFTAALPALPRNEPVTFRLTATAPGAAPWETEVLATRGARSDADVRVPERDRTPPVAVLLLQSDDRVVSSVSPVRRDGDRPIRLAGPLVSLTAVIRDVDGGTGRIRASLTYETVCGARVRRRTLHFPPSEIARVRLSPGVRAPSERRRRATVRLETGGAGCRIRGRTWADATNASGLESFSDHIHFELELPHG